MGTASRSRLKYECTKYNEFGHWCNDQADDSRSWIVCSTVILRSLIGHMLEIKPGLSTAVSTVKNVIPAFQVVFSSLVWWTRKLKQLQVGYHINSLPSVRLGALLMMWHQVWQLVSYSYFVSTCWALFLVWYSFTIFLILPHIMSIEIDSQRAFQSKTKISFLD